MPYNHYSAVCFATDARNKGASVFPWRQKRFDMTLVWQLIKSDHLYRS